MPLPRILAVFPFVPATLVVRWQDGSERRVDIGAWIVAGGPILAPLQDPAVFLTAKVVGHGSAVQWAGPEDLAIDAVHLQLLAKGA